MVNPNHCRYCGGKPYLSNHSFTTGPALWFVKCPCGMSGPVQYSEDSAADAWNKIRVEGREDDVLEALRERQELDGRKL